MSAVGVLSRQSEVESMFGARRAVERYLQPEATKARGANQHEVRRFTVSRLGEVAKTLLHEVAAGQPREIHDSFYRETTPSTHHRYLHASSAYRQLFISELVAS